jgi:DNA-directed RNA polymerase subunit K/omega
MSDDENSYVSEDDEAVVLPPGVSSDEDNDDDDDDIEIDDDAGTLVDAAGTRPIVVLARRKLPDTLSLFEWARVVGLRAQDIARSNNPMVDPAGHSDPIDIAVAEIMQGRCPLSLRRFAGRRPGGERVVEIWAVNDLVPPANVGR